VPPITSPDATRARFGEQLRSERERQGRSQGDVAAAIGTDQKVVSRAERGLATIETQIRIAAELGLDLMAAS